MTSYYHSTLLYDCVIAFKLVVLYSLILLINIIIPVAHACMSIYVVLKFLG